MIWPTSIEPALPDPCEPANDFLFRFSSSFHTCVPTNHAFISTTLGSLSILAWLFAQLPQIYKNYSIKSTSGLSIFFLLDWCLGDVSNLLGALFTRQATWQVIIGAYYCSVDFALVLQWLWYEKLRYGRPEMLVWLRKSKDRDRAGRLGDMEEVIIEVNPALSQTSPDERVIERSRDDAGKDGVSKNSRPWPIFRTPTLEPKTEGEEKADSSVSATPSGRVVQRVGPSSSMHSPSPRTVLFLVCLVALTQASPLPSSATIPKDAGGQAPTAIEMVGTILAWTSTLLYLSSRLPQLFKNWARKSTAGLSPLLFIAAFFGNLFYSSSILTNPCAWNDYGAYGGGGWVDAGGSQKGEWIARALPFWLGAAGVLVLDGSVGVQFVMYGDGDAKVVVVGESDGNGKRWRWRRVRGWMRGWMPSVHSDGKAAETDTLIQCHGERGEGYGTLAL